MSLLSVVPVHFVEHAGQRAERGFQRLLVGLVLGQKVERRADQRVGSCAALIAASSTPSFSEMSTRPRHQQAEGHGLRIAVGELRVAGFGKQQLAPVFLKSRRLPLPAAICSRYLLAQQAAQARAGLRELPWRWWRLRRPLQNPRSARERFRRLQLRARGFDVAFEEDDLACEFAVAPQAEAVAVGVDEVRQGLELAPLRRRAGRRICAGRRPCPAP